MRTEAPSVLAGGLVSAGLMMIVFNNLAAVFNYIFQAMMARHLETADFGLMNALFGLMTFLSLPVTVYGSIFTRQWAEFCHAGRPAEADRVWWAMITGASGLALIGVLIAMLFLRPIAWFLNTTNFIAVGVALAATALQVIFSLATPLATARQWFGVLAAGAFLGCLLRLAFGWLAIERGMPLSGAVAATALSGAVLAMLVLGRLRWPGWATLPFRKLLPPWKEWRAPLLLAWASFMILGVDMLVMRHRHSEEEAGRFAQVMLLGRIVFFAIGPIAAVVLPKTARSSEKAMVASGETRVVRRALGMSLLLLVMIAAGLCLLAPVGFQLLRGTPADPEMLRLLRLAVWCLIPLSLCQLILPALFARRQERWLLEFAALSLLLPTGLVFFSESLTQAFLVEGATGILLLGFVIWRVRATLRPKNKSAFPPLEKRVRNL